MYSEADVCRRLPEPAKLAAPRGAADYRGEFARDRARVLHSAALRRLAGKTQVVGPGEDGAAAPRTRLTHSIEVAQIGRELAVALGADPDVVDTAGLAHDIGHPPFGHNGERALDEAAADCGGFEGNAQTLRILTRLEPKILDVDGASRGLNLTRACLDATVKYPWQRAEPGGKFGVYAEDAEVFGWLRRDTPPGARSVEAQIMDWADDVAYSVHDVEDAVVAGRVSLSVLADPGQRSDLAEMAGVEESAGQELLAVPAVAELVKSEYDGTLRAQIALKALTSELVGRFATAAVGATRAEYGPGELARYRANLLVPAGIRAEVALLKAVALRYVMRDPARLKAQARQRELLAELVAAIANSAPARLDPVHSAAWLSADDEPGRRRVIIDQVAAFTDAQAIAAHTGTMESRPW